MAAMANSTQATLRALRVVLIMATVVATSSVDPLAGALQGYIDEVARNYSIGVGLGYVDDAGRELGLGAGNRSEGDLMFT